MVDIISNKEITHYGSGAHIVIPKKYVKKKATIIIENTTNSEDINVFESMKSGVITTIELADKDTLIKIAHAVDEVLNKKQGA